MFDSRINAMFEILGEPRAAAILRKIHRDSACLSCATPAVMDLEEPGIIPALPALSSRSPGVGTESLNPKGDGDHLCYPRHPIPHQKDSRYIISNSVDIQMTVEATCKTIIGVDTTI